MARIITPEAILSYPNLITPRANENGPDKFGCALVFPAGTDLTAVKQSVLQEAQEKWADKLQGAEIQYFQTEHGQFPFLVAGNLKIRLPWRDHPEDVAKKGYPEGSTFFNTKSTRAPGLVTIYADEETGKPMTLQDESKLRAGAIVKASVSPWAYDEHGTGVTLTLGNVQWIREGDPDVIGANTGAPATDEFEADPSATADLSDVGVEGEGEPAGAAAGDGDDLGDLLG